MNKQLASFIITLLIFPPVAISQPAVDETVTEPSAVSTGLQQTATTSDKNQATVKTEMVKAPATDTTVEPMTGAFGITLGEHFKLSMVASVLSKQEHTYSGEGGKKLKGQLLRFEPVEPDERFQQYSIMTTDDGLIYAIEGDYHYKTEMDESQSTEVKDNESKPKGSGKGAGKPGNRQLVTAIQLTCKTAVKTLASDLESRYGKPSGQGWDGLWYTFRQSSEASKRSLKLYGHRCRTGMYSIIYIDEAVQRGTLSGRQTRNQ